MKQFIALNLLLLTIAHAQVDVATAPSPLTQKVSSFGACVSDGYVYVYGGHTGEAHAHSKENLSADFLRYQLNTPDGVWEKLPEDKGVQGTALVSWNGLVIRVAGMYATNAPDEDDAMFSTDSVRSYDPKAKAWSDLPSLPGKVSSHHAVVFNDVLYVIGGWELNGDDGTWHKHGWSLNLNKSGEGWKGLPAMPGVRRAGTMDVAGGKIWFVGGMGDKGGPSNSVFAFNPADNSWEEGPDLPATSKIKGFGSSTFSSGDVLFNSGMDGVLYALSPAGDRWTATSVNHQYGRIFHRSVPVGNGVFWTIAGASRKGHRDDIEVLPVPEQFPLTASATVWPSFRGGANNGVDARKMPLHWGDDSDLAWKVTLPGYGQSTPVYGGGGVYVTSSVLEEVPEGEVEEVVKYDKVEEKEDKPAESGKGGEKAGKSKGGKGRSEKGGGRSMAGVMEAANGPMKTEIAVTRIDQESGEIVWTTKLPSSDPEPSNKYRSSAAPTPCFDDEAVYAWFETGDLVALSHEGEKLWRVNIGEKKGLPKGNHGLGGSLVQDEDSLYVLVDHDGPSYLLSLDKKSGEIRWEVDREKRVSWSTPVVTEDAVIISSNGLVEEVDKATGEQRWVVEGIEGNTAATPLVFGNFVLAPSSGKEQTQLIRRGETDERVVWKATKKNTSSFSSPVFAQGQIILVSKAGIASGLDWRTGEERWVLRLPSGCWASPAVVGNKVYFFSTSGVTLVASLTPSGLHELHSNKLSVGESKIYGVIAAGDKWIIRTGGEVIAVGGDQKES